MENKRKKVNMQAIVETIFDIGYLIFAISAGLILIICGAGRVETTHFGAMVLILGLGDSFHLLPRVYSLGTGTMEKNFRALAFGKLVTSITMTVFYVLLFEFWQIYFKSEGSSIISIVVYALAVIRIILCVLPQNKWFEKESSFKFAIVRNIPFAILGGVVAVLFATVSPISRNSFALMPIAILLSFAFYFIVVLWAPKKPPLGSFMLPKTCVYIWMICMGFSLI